MTTDISTQLIEAFTANDPDALGALMDVGVTWHAVDARAAGQANCADRQAVVALIRHQIAAGLRAEVVEAQTAGSMVMLGIQMSAPADLLPDLPQDRPVYMVITTRAGRVVHLQDCADRPHAAGLAGVA